MVDRPVAVRVQHPLHRREVDYQLQIEMVLTDEYGGHQVTLTGSGSITAYEGARYYVDIVKDSSGTWVATLVPATTT